MSTPYLVNVDGVYKVYFAKGFKPKNAVALVPSSIAVEDYDVLTVEDQFDPMTGITTKVVVVDEAAKAEKLLKEQDEKAKQDKEKAFKDLKKERFEDVFQSVNSDDALSFYILWLDMKSDPSKYIAEGLVDEQGKALDTATKVFNYAEERLIKAIDAGLQILKEKQK